MSVPKHMFPSGGRTRLMLCRLVALFTLQTGGVFSLFGAVFFTIFVVFVGDLAVKNGPQV